MKPGTAKYFLDEKGQFYVLVILDPALCKEHCPEHPPYNRPFTEVEVEDHEGKLDWPINTAMLHWAGDEPFAQTVIRSPDGKWAMSD